MLIVINQEIEERRASPDDSRTDVLNMLMAARDENGEAMTNAELSDELMTLLTAGHETHQREDLYPEPKKFKPERFLERQFSPYEFIPFGGGARRCIGMAFAQFEMKLILTNILRNLELDLIDNGEIKPQRRGLVTGPNRPIQMVVKGKRTIKSRSLSVVN